MDEDLEEVKFDKVKFDNIVQGCTIIKSNIKTATGWLKLTCVTCDQLGYFENDYQQGKAVGLHFADKIKYPIK